MKGLISCIICTVAFFVVMTVLLATYATNRKDWSNHPPHSDHPHSLAVNLTAGSTPTISTQTSATVDVIEDYEDNGRPFDGHADDEALELPSQNKKRHVTTEPPNEGEESDSDMGQTGSDSSEKTGDKRVVTVVKTVEEDPIVITEKRSKVDESANEKNEMVSGSKKLVSFAVPTKKPMKTSELKKFVGGSDEIIEEEEEEEIVVKKKKHASPHDN